MYNIESRTLKTSIGLLLSSGLDEDKTIEEEIAFYYPLVLDMIVKVLNNSNTCIEEAIMEELNKYSDQRSMQLFYELLFIEIRDIRKQFIIAGFDGRMRYKLKERSIPRSNIKLHAIVMDLDGTLEYLTAQSNDNLENQDVSDTVIDNPSIDQLESYFDKR